MGGLALMGILQKKNGNVSPSLSPHWGLCTHILSLLVIASQPIARSES